MNNDNTACCRQKHCNILIQVGNTVHQLLQPPFKAFMTLIITLYVPLKALQCAIVRLCETVRDNFLFAQYVDSFSCAVVRACMFLYFLCFKVNV